MPAVQDGCGCHTAQRHRWESRLTCALNSEIESSGVTTETLGVHPGMWDLTATSICTCSATEQL